MDLPAFSRRTSSSIHHVLGSRSINPQVSIEVAIGNLITLSVMLLVYYNFLLFREYVPLFLVAMVVALAFGGWKSSVVDFLRGTTRGKDLRSQASGELTHWAMGSKPEMVLLLAAFGVSCWGAPMVAALIVVVVVVCSLALLVWLVVMRMVVRLRVADAHTVAALFVMGSSFGAMLSLVVVSVIGMTLDAAGSTASVVSAIREEMTRRGFQANEMIQRIDVDEVVRRGVEQMEARLDDVVYETLEKTVPPQFASLATTKCGYRAVAESEVCKTLTRMRESYVESLKADGLDDEQVQDRLESISIGNVTVPIPKSSSEVTEVIRRLVVAYAPADLIAAVDVRVPHSYQDGIQLLKQLYRELGPRGIWEHMKALYAYTGSSSFRSLGKTASRIFEGSADLGTRLGSLAWSLFSTTVKLITSSADLLETSLVFFGALFFLLRREEDPVATMANLIPLPDRASRSMVEKDIKSAVRTLFWSRCRSFFRNALFTFLMFSGFQLSFEVLAAWLAGITAVITVLPDPWVFTLVLGGVQLAFKRAWIRIAVLGGSHFLLNQLVDDEEPDGFEGVSSLVAFSAVIGTSVFGSQGAGYGPLLVYLLVIFHKVYQRLAPNDDQDITGNEKDVETTSVGKHHG